MPEVFRILLAAILSFGSVAPRAAAPGPPSPVLELVSPTLSPACADSAIAVALVPSVLKGVTLPAQVYTLLGPVVVLCGSVPLPNGRYACVLDANAIKQLGALAPTVSSVAPVLPPPLGTLIQQVAYVENAVTPGAPLHLTATIAATIQCVGARAATSPSVTAPPSTTTAAPAVVPPSDVAPGVVPPPPPSTPSPPSPAPPSSPVSPSSAPLPPQAAAPIATVSSGGFQYPAVILLPLVLLALVGYLTSAFTRPIPVRRAPARRQS